MRYTEPFNTSWHAFHSSTYVQQYLNKCYSKLGFDDAERKSYDNCYRFMYFMEYGDRYFKHAHLADTELKPILLFYGMIQLLKGCLLTLDPNYPSDTLVLAHGVTSRKRKKRQYSFLQDEVKGQKNGLFEYFSRKMFHVKQVEGEKYQMNDLLSLIPEIAPLIKQLSEKVTSFRLTPTNANTFTVSSHILDTLNMTTDRFESYLNQQLPVEVTTVSSSERGVLMIHFDGDLSRLHSRPMLSCGQDLYLPAKRSQYHSIHEVMVHYLLLYNLSMICRYETEWWGDLFHTRESNDLPFILEFLDIAAEKVPLLLYEYLMERI
ncbi:YaaC family protein [Guptibacillus algicola]|uniref:YaaC family protein n=1 Tax=Guptibacillus algicola TaxID=225844 RepID=UPI001CD4B3F0|nr:YaaC family protein [Alkalihalobacillus algicola]MCA0989631.1 YaaC family protein [Alkalihalobacillus algicola]